MPRLSFALLSLLIACSGKSDEAAPEPTGSKPLSCDERMDRFAAALAPVAKQGGALLSIPPEIDPIESAAGDPVRQRGPVVVLGRDGAVTLDGERLDSAETELASRLEARLEQERNMGYPEPTALYIWADRRTPAQAVTAVAAAAPDGLTARLAVAGPQPKTSDYEAELLRNDQVAAFRADVMGAAGPSQKATLAAERIEKAIGLCAPLIRVFGAVAGIDAANKGEYMADAAPKALRECGCNVADLDLLEYAMLAIMGAFERPIRSIPVTEAARVLSQ